MIYETLSSAETFEIGKKLGGQSKKGQVFCLIGDLGVGKTTFTQGFAKGLEIDEHISSPTYTIVNEYDEGRIPFYHFDVYRISHIEEMDEIGYEEYFFGNGVSLVEWANLVEEIIPEDAIWIYIEKDLEKGLDYRKVTVNNLVL
ncbi:tRNA threonylcarbamoyladenosine biosynthesis protein TsaE [Natranaerovirga pectinivora]|uniref:tRNA threonylcarbamoyladenosine biosynthesis protein TsaE n=1 Tax=Natranaerovirga pectinivora TaxID=682400 RepID=A0A4R3MNT9_9FIRM|nr:tRNA (adenosine(37)-N6)-threonylcarbamoyltransferase complex ATPase subunit type 1 TsaE [Natranaerovirga pectinivora]TCT13779.1 tRNA threonylcarbamoyladenosine biosynthesis protein TsaE [Natranaerovirga pectinivora]